MTGTIYSGTYLNGIILSDPATQETVTVTGTVTNTNSDAIFGTNAFPWTVNNRRTIANNGTSGAGVQLLNGGTVNNQLAAASVEGYNQGVLIKGAAGLVTNLGLITATSTAGRGIDFTEGGRVINGSVSVTTATIAGGRNAVVISGAIGAVANFGTMTSSASSHSAVVLQAGGSVTNGSSISHAALISGTGGGSGVYISNGAGTVTNFGSIGGATGVNLHTGGTVTNGPAGSATSTITATNGNAVLIAGAAGTVTNLGTLRALGSHAVVSLIDGGRVTNGDGDGNSPLISGSGSGIYLGHLAGTVINFGTVAATSTAGGTAVVLEAGGSVSNEGTLENAASNNAAVYLRGGGSVTNADNGAILGQIIGAGNAISVRGGAATVTNSGVIHSNSANGIYLNGGGIVANQHLGLIDGALNGIYNRGVAIAVSNAGVIRTSGAGTGIYLKGGGSVTNQSGGSIVGAGAGILVAQRGAMVTNAGIITGTVGILGTTGGNLTLTNSGTVSSSLGTGGTAVQLGSSVGKDVLIVEAGATFIGAVNGGGDAEIDFVPGGAANMANVFGFATIGLGNGVGHSLTLTNANFNNVGSKRITVLGGDSGNSVNASTVTFGPVVFVGGAGVDHFSGGASSDVFKFSATTLTGSDTVAGNGGFDNELLMTSAGTVTATGVTGVEIFQLANGGANTLNVANSNFTGVSGGFIRVYGGSSGNTVNGAGVTGSSDQLVIYGGAGVDHLTGGAGNDVFVFTPATLTTTDTVVGGGGTDELLMTAHGTINAGGVSGVERFVLASGGTNTLSLASANFTGVVGSTITVYDGNSGNAVNASTLPSTDKIMVHAGAGTDTLTGGAGGDTFFAGGKTTMTGGLGSNKFTFADIGSNVITDFGASATNGLVFSNSGFNLGFSGATSTPTLWTAPEIAAHFSTGAGTYASASAGFDYTGGMLFYSATGSSSTQHLVATLTGSPVITAASQLFVVS